MSKLHHSVKINASVSKVWQILADLEAVQHYIPTVAGAKYISEQKSGVGAARHCDFTSSGFAKERVTEWKPEEVLGLEMYESSWPMKFMRWRTMLRNEDGGTLMSQDMEYELKFGILGQIMDRFMMRRKLDGIMNEVFSKLKHFVESGAKPS